MPHLRVRIVCVSHRWHRTYFLCFDLPVTKSPFTVCAFYHREFTRCKIIDKHLGILASKHFETKFIRIDAEKAPFFVQKLQVKTLPCVILFIDGIAVDRIVGYDTVQLACVCVFACPSLRFCRSLANNCHPSLIDHCLLCSSVPHARPLYCQV
jgi:hypothetical protein